MQEFTPNPAVPTYQLEPDEPSGNREFRVYDFEGDVPNRADLLVPHRKGYYLLIFIRRASTRQWIDMTPYVLKDHAVYFTGLDQIIVKEGFEPIWSTGIAFTAEFLAHQENASLAKLPLIQNPQLGPELLLTEADALFVEDLVGKISTEYQRPGEWQQRMLGAYLTVLLTYLSRLYTEQRVVDGNSTDKQLLKAFQTKIDTCFRERHEVSDYAAMLNLSAGYLSEVVKAQSGKSAIKHIHERLILEARRLLFHTQQSPKEITFDLGFSDASYFNRFFKRETGLTQAHYRDSIRKMYQ